MSIWDTINFSQDSAATKVAPLEHYSHFTITGPDAFTFLQGQLTCDLSSTTAGDATFSAHCNPKGRVISSFLIYRLAEDSFLFRVADNLKPLAENALRKYMVFSKANLESDTGYISIALWGNNLDTVSEAIKERIPSPAFRRHSDTYAELCLNHAAISELSPLLSQCQIADAAESKYQQIQCGIADIHTNTSERYLPQEINYDKIGAVSFKKGCYTGQEVVARLHYKGKLKKHLRLGSYEGAPLSIDDKIYDKNTQSACGVIINTAKGDQKTNAILALVDDQCANEDICVTARAEGAKIQWLDLPYAIT